MGSCMGMGVSHQLVVQSTFSLNPLVFQISAEVWSVGYGFLGVQENTHKNLKVSKEA